MTLEKNLTTTRIRQWAGARSYGRGEDYFREGHVSALKAVKGRITATVDGTHPYRVMLWEQGDGIGYDCDCPVGQDGDFCKHCVATALAWLEKRAPSGTAARGNRKPRADNGLTMKDVRAWLLLQEKEVLADLLVQAATEDDQLSGSLMLKAAAAKGANLATYRCVLDQAIGIDGFIDYHDTFDYWRTLDSAIDGVEELLGKGHAGAVIELSEYALRALERAMNSIMDDGEMGMLQERLQDLHLRACRKAKPDPVVLAERLFQWELASEWDTFSAAASTYARMLGKTGMQRYRELAEAEWSKVKPLKPGGQDRSQNGRRFRITAIMECLARQAGDTEALVSIKQRDLSSSYRYLEIAEIYRKARRSDQALAWAEKGIKAFGEQADIRLLDFLAELYHRRRRQDEAMALIWPQFERHPGLANYQKLKTHADRCKRWPEWRKRALEQLRALLAREQPRKSRSRWSYSSSLGHSALVEIFLWEKDPASAWREACEGGCSQELWLKLAALRETDHPRDAIAVYQRAIGPIVERTNNDAYAEAAGLLRRVQRLMSGLGEDAEFRQYLAAVRDEYKRKRNFIRVLQKFGVPVSAAGQEPGW